MRLMIKRLRVRIPVAPLGNFEAISFAFLCSNRFNPFDHRPLPKAVGPFYLVSIPGEVNDPPQGVNV